MECARLREAGFWGRPFRVPQHETKCRAADLDGCQPAGEWAGGAPGACEICGDDAALARAPCCGALLCSKASTGLDPADRNLCTRSHARYTLCGMHHSFVTGAPGGGGHAGRDWRDCAECAAKMREHTELRWNGASPYNLRPPRPPPQGAMWTKACAGCGRRMFLCMDAHAELPEHPKHRHDTWCGACCPAAGTRRQTEHVVC